MNGVGIVKGLMVTLRHFAETYIEDWKGGRKRYWTPEGIDQRLRSDAKGIFTIQYPEEKMPVPEEFRYLPFLVFDEGLNGEKNLRCTSCGICAKVCPPQCIWIERTADPVTGKPVPVPSRFSIDIDICMNCGLCAEYCPFDAIKMDHDYEIASYDRKANHLYDIEKLSKPASYYTQIRPNHSAAEEIARAEKNAARANKPGKPIQAE